MKLDLLVIAAHPDDAELGCGATLAKHAARGYAVGVVDLSRGELGTRGSADLRAREAAAAASVLKLAQRENLGLPDGFFQADRDTLLQLVAVIRKYQPRILIANAVEDRHPDHGRAAALVAEAVFLSGLPKIVTSAGGQPQAAHRPQALYHMIQSQPLTPDLVVDVSGFWDVKMQAIRAFASQFHNPASREPDTFISQPGFLEMIEARGRDLGYLIGASHGEGFTVRRFPGVGDLFHLL